MFGGKRPEVLSERVKIPADGVSPTKICVRFTEDPGPEVELRLSKYGSFSGDSQVKSVTVPVKNNEANLTVYAARRPGTTYLVGPGIKQRLDFIATSFVQGLVFEWIPMIVSALAIALVLRHFVVASFFIPSGSMLDTLHRGDFLIADKLSYKLLGQSPQRGDIMIFIHPPSAEDSHLKKQDYIKRVIGLPGEEVKVRDGVVFVDGVPLEEDYIKEKPNRDYGPRKVPKGQYFVMGDNRNHSSDSRVWGFVDRKYFEGRALFVFWPPQRAKVIQHGGHPMNSAVAAE